MEKYYSYKFIHFFELLSSFAIKIGVEYQIIKNFQPKIAKITISKMILKRVTGRAQFVGLCGSYTFVKL